MATTYTFGSQPEDVLTNSHGDVLAGVPLTFYPTAADAVAGTNSLGSATTDGEGRWRFTSDTHPVIFAVTPKGAANEGEVWSCESYEYAIDPAVSQAAAQAAQAAAEAAQTAAEAAQTAAENTEGKQGPKGDAGAQGPRGLQGPKGDEGDSAYQIWLDAGNTGTVADFLLSLKGPKGDPGGGGGTGGGDVYSTRIIAAGLGLKGGGDLSADRTISADFGTGAGKVTEGNDPRLSDARTPKPHTHSISDISQLWDVLDSKASADSPTFTGTVTGITPSMVGLSQVDNTSDLDKPISTATQAALDNLAGKGWDGVPAGAVGAVFYTTGSEARPSDRTDISFLWVGPKDVTPSNAVAGKDIILAAAS